MNQTQAEINAEILRISGLFNKRVRAWWVAAGEGLSINAQGERERVTCTVEIVGTLIGWQHDWSNDHHLMVRIAGYDTEVESTFVVADSKPWWRFW